MVPQEKMALYETKNVSASEKPKIALNSVVSSAPIRGNYRY
jgi:hypothetical protein